MIHFLELPGQAIGCLAEPSSSKRKIMNWEQQQILLTTTKCCLLLPVILCSTTYFVDILVHTPLHYIVTWGISCFIFLYICRAEGIIVICYCSCTLQQVIFRTSKHTVEFWVLGSIQFFITNIVLLCIFYDSFKAIY